jgi:hypothetical protein
LWLLDLREERIRAAHRNELQRELCARRKASGRCIECGERAEPERVLCSKHAKAFNAKSKRVYYERKANGWCVKCGRDKEQGRESSAKCFACAQDANERERDRQARRKLTRTSLNET